MDKRLNGLCLFLLACACLLSTACATTTSENPHDNWLVVGSQQQERATGREIFERLESQDAIFESDTFTRYVSNIGRRLAIYSDWNQIDYTFTILRTFHVNAFALPGGYVFVTRGLLHEIRDEAELAGVLAHEIAHVAARHHAKQKQVQMASLIASLALASTGEVRAAQGGFMAGQMAQLGYSRAHERQADKLGLEYATRAGYDPEGLIRFLKTLRDIQDEIPDRELVFLQTHPYLTDRVRQAKARVGGYLERLEDTPVVNRYRYNRARRQWLIPPREHQVLDRFQELIASYQQQDTVGMSAVMHEDFKADMGDTEISTEPFLKSIARQLDGADTIDYDYRLFELEAGDTDATVTYEFQIARWDDGSTRPAYTDGAQRLIWRREQDQWQLIRLR